MNDTTPGQASMRIGRYELFQELASGGMATVHIGRLKGAVGFSRMVAIKRLHTHLVKDRQFVTMFVDEARLAARIQHPNVIPIIDVVQTEDELFLVMEYVQGASLARAATLGRKSGIAVPIQVAASIAAGVLHGLHAAHEARDDHGEPLNIVHRDVSPQNVIVGIDGVPRVLDFGIAKAKGRLQNTAEGVVKGKLTYMAPEQVGGADVGREADLYAVGVMLWELLAGRRLHAGVTETLLLASVLLGVKDPPSKFRPDVPEALDRLVLQSLSLDPAARLPTARAFALALEDAIPIASSAQIGLWLEQVADEVLEQSAIIAASVDSRPRSFADIPLSIDAMVTPTGAPAVDPPRAPGVVAPIERTHVSTRPAPPPPAPPAIPPRPARSSFERAALVAVAVLLAGVFAVTRLRPSKGVTPEDAARAAAVPASMAATPPARPGSAEAAPAPVSTAAAVTATPSTVSATSTGSRPGLAVRRFVVRPAGVTPPTAAPPPAAPAPAPPPAKADCDPPYTLDSRGVQRLKPQCL